MKNKNQKRQIILLGMSLMFFHFSAAAAPAWPSGVFRPNSFFYQVKGSTLDVCQVYGKNSLTWGDLANQVGSKAFDKTHCGSFVFAMRIFPTNELNAYKNRCQAFREVASGKYNAYYKSVGNSLSQTGINPDRFVVRVGWEINGDVAERPWYVGACDSSDPASPNSANYVVKAYQQIIDSLRSGIPGVKTAWNWMKNSARVPLPIMSYYPGSSYIDIISVDYYDIGLNDANDANQFLKYANTKGTSNKPLGLLSWLNFAKSLEKKFALDEWGVWDGAGGYKDNPGYIEGMYQFLNSHKDDVFYELYFNGDSSRLGDGHPKASGSYSKFF